MKRIVAVAPCVFGALLGWSAAPGAVGQERLDLQIAPLLQSPDDGAFVPGRLLVKFENWVSAYYRSALLHSFGAEWEGAGYGDHFEMLSVPPGSEMSVARELAEVPGVVYAEPDFYAHAFDVPTDPLFSPYQWNLYDYGQLSQGVPSNFGIQMPTATNVSQGGGVIVAIVDTGVAYENFGSFAQAPDLAGQTFESPYNFVNNTSHANDDNGHGTHVCGTVAQRTNNGLGVAGIAYNCRIMPVKVLNSAGSGSHSQIANGINYAAANGAFVINLSLGSSTGSSTLQNAVNNAWSLGSVLCAATGNSGSGQIAYPARYDNCMAVGATRFDGARASYSQRGKGIDVVAPGGDINVDQNGDGYGDGILQQTFSGNPTSFSYYFFVGTSMATPHASATAALVRAASNKTNAQVRSAIESTCKDRGSAGYDTTYGFGIVNAAAAVIVP